MFPDAAMPLTHFVGTKNDADGYNAGHYKNPIKYFLLQILVLRHCINSNRVF